MKVVLRWKKGPQTVKYMVGIPEVSADRHWLASEICTWCPFSSILFYSVPFGSIEYHTIHFQWSSPSSRVLFPLHYYSPRHRAICDVINSLIYSLYLYNYSKCARIVIQLNSLATVCPGTGARSGANWRHWRIKSGSSTPNQVFWIKYSKSAPSSFSNRIQSICLSVWKVLFCFIYKMLKFGLPANNAHSINNSESVQLL